MKKKIYPLLRQFIAAAALAGSMLHGETVQAQTWKWARSTNTPDEVYERAVAVDKNGNSYVVGEFLNAVTLGTQTLNNPGFWCVFLAKYDNAGNVVWARTAAQTFSDVFVTGVCVDRQGNIAITGNFVDVLSVGETNPVVLNATGGYDTYTALFNSQGQVQWAHTIGAPDLDIANGVSSDKAGNIYVTGELHIGSAQVSADTIFVAKYSPAGSLLWNTKTRSANTQNSYAGIQTDSVGNSYIAGEFFSHISFGPSLDLQAGHPESAAFLAKFDANGANTWIQQVGAGSGYTYCRGIGLDKYGNAYITGYYHGTVSAGSFSLPAPAGGGVTYDSYLAKCDKNGSFKWAKSIPVNGTDDQAAALCFNEQDEGYLASYFKDSAQVAGTVLHGSGGMDIYVVHFDTAGVLNWAKSCGGPQDDAVGKISANSTGASLTGGFVQSASFGSTVSVSAAPGHPEGFLARIINGPNGISTQPLHTRAVSVYPVPANDYVYISGYDREEPLTITILDGQGKRIRTVNTKSNTALDISGLAGGTYWLQILSGQDEITTKLLKQ